MRWWSAVVVAVVMDVLEGGVEKKKEHGLRIFMPGRGALDEVFTCGFGDAGSVRGVTEARGWKPEVGSRV